MCKNICYTKDRADCEMLELTTAASLWSCLESHPYVVLCAYIPLLERGNILGATLGNLAVVTPGIVFAQADFTLPAMTSFKLSLGVSRFPSLIFVARGDVKEIVVGEDMDSILRTLVKWYKTVYLTQ